MKILIDTHIFLWALSAPYKINVQKRADLETLSNTVYVSSITNVSWKYNHDAGIVVGLAMIQF